MPPWWRESCPELNGVLVRNGPNPLTGVYGGNDVLDWWPEAAMVHAVTFRDGRAVGYRNRWLRTRRWAEVHEPTRANALIDTNPNVNVVAHAGESWRWPKAARLVIDRELRTHGAATRHPSFAAGVTAHPKIDPVTGELMTFRSHWSEPSVRYGVCAAEGGEIHAQDIDVPQPAMMHRTWRLPRPAACCSI